MDVRTSFAPAPTADRFLEISIRPSGGGELDGLLRPGFVAAHQFAALLISDGHILPRHVNTVLILERHGCVVLSIRTTIAQARALKSLVDSMIPRFFEGR